MTEMDQLSRLRAEVPARVSPEADRRFHAAFAAECSGAISRSATRSGRWARPRVVLVAALAPAAAAAIAIAAFVGAVPRSPASHPATAVSPGSGALPTVAQLAYRASTAALAQPTVSPGQWLYVKTTIVTWTGSHRYTTTTEAWQTADELKMAYYSGGKLEFRPVPVMSGDLSYADLTKFPAGPRALAKYVFSRVNQGKGLEGSYARLSPKVAWSVTFGWMAGSLISFDLPPKVAAEVFQAMPYIPGVTVEKVPGGVAFEGPFGDDKVIFDPSSYAPTSILLTGPSAANWMLFTFPSRVPVSGPGVRP